MATLLSAMLSLFLHTMTLLSTEPQHAQGASLTSLCSPAPGIWASMLSLPEAPGSMLLFPLSKDVLLLHISSWSFPQATPCERLTWAHVFSSGQQPAPAILAQLASSPPASHKNMKQNVLPRGWGSVLLTAVTVPRAWVPKAEEEKKTQLLGEATGNHPSSESLSAP